MTPTRNSFLFTALVASSLLAPLPAAAAARIEVDSANFDMGTIHEGAMDVAKHQFTIKNTGSETLRIEKVKPG
jgi:hypothetical protein